MTEGKKESIYNSLLAGEEVTCILRLNDDVLYLGLTLDDLCEPIDDKSDLDLVIFKSLVLKYGSEIYSYLSDVVSFNLDVIYD